MKFSKFYEAKQANNIAEIETIFQQADKDIKALFVQLVKGTKDLVGRHQKAQLPDEFKKSIIQDLTKIAQKINGSSSASPAAPAASKLSFRDPLAKEAVMVNTYIRSVMESITEAATMPSMVAGLGSHATGDTGKPVYDFQSAITNIYRQVMERMTMLKDSVFKHLGIWQQRIGGLQKNTGSIRNQVGDLQNTLSNPPQPLSSQESEAAHQSMIELGGLMKSAQQPVKLVTRDGTEINVDPRSRNWMQQVSQAGLKDKRFTIKVGSISKDVNIGSTSDVSDAIEDIQSQLNVDTAAPSIAPTADADSLKTARQPRGKVIDAAKNAWAKQPEGLPKPPKPPSA